MIVLAIFGIFTAIFLQNCSGGWEKFRYIPETQCVNGFMYTVDPEDEDLEPIQYRAGWGQPGSKVRCKDYNPEGDYVYDD